MVDKLCTQCRSHQFRRVNRIGFLQHRILTRMGYFPWECILCRRRMFFRDDGRRVHQNPPAAPQREMVETGSQAT